MSVIPLPKKPAAAIAVALDDCDPNTIWVLLWSQSQNALHVERMRDMYQSNIEAFNDNRRLDYVPLHIGTRVAVDNAAERVRPICHLRESARCGRNRV